MIVAPTAHKRLDAFRTLPNEPGGERARGQAEGRGRLTDQRRDGVLELRPLHRDVGGLRPRRIELRLRLSDVGLRGRATLEAVDRERECRREGFHRLVQELFLSVGGPQLEIIHRQLGLETEPGGLEIGLRGLGLFPGRRHRPADPAPQVDLI